MTAVADRQLQIVHRIKGQIGEGEEISIVKIHRRINIYELDTKDCFDSELVPVILALNTDPRDFAVNAV